MKKREGGRERGMKMNKCIRLIVEGKRNRGDQKKE